MSQPVAGELHLEIANQSPYPKLEQTGLYSVDADTYKYVQVTLVNNSPKNKLTFVSPSGGNEFSTSDMTPNSGEAQTIEVNLSEFTNWSGTQANWWFQLVENPGDGAVASAGSMDIQQILFTTVGLSTSNNEILDMMIFPNPVDGNYVTIVTPVQGSKEIQVFTVTGRKVMDTTINGNTLDVSSFNSGFYMLKVTINGQSKVSKLVVR